MRPRAGPVAPRPGASAAKRAGHDGAAQGERHVLDGCGEKGRTTGFRPAGRLSSPPESFRALSVAKKPGRASRRERGPPHLPAAATDTAGRGAPTAMRAPGGTRLLTALLRLSGSLLPAAPELLLPLPRSEPGSTAVLRARLGAAGSRNGRKIQTGEYRKPSPHRAGPCFYPAGLLNALLQSRELRLFFPVPNKCNVGGRAASSHARLDGSSFPAAGPARAAADPRALSSRRGTPRSARLSSAHRTEPCAGAREAAAAGARREGLRRPLRFWRRSGEKEGGELNGPRREASIPCHCLALHGDFTTRSLI